MKRIILLISALLLCLVLASCDSTESEPDNTTIPLSSNVEETPIADDPSNTTEAPQPTETPFYSETDAPAPTDTENISDTDPAPDPGITIDKSIIIDRLSDGISKEELEKIIPSNLWTMGEDLYYNCYKFSDGSAILFDFGPMRPTKDSSEDTQYTGVKQAYYQYYDENGEKVYKNLSMRVFYTFQGSFYYLVDTILDSSVMDKLYAGISYEDFQKIIPKDIWEYASSSGLIDAYTFSDESYIHFTKGYILPYKDSPVEDRYWGMYKIAYFNNNINSSGPVYVLELPYDSESRYYYFKESPESTDTNTVS